MERRALIAGYYGMHNTGDDCLLAVASWGVRTCLHTGRLFALTGKLPDFMNSELVVPVYAPGQAVKGYNRLAEWASAFKSDSIVFGGGSVFSSVRDIRRKMALLKLSGNGPHFAVGVSLGPFNCTKAEKYCRELLKRMAFVGLRDQQSLDIVESWALDINAVKTFDMAPLLPKVHGLTVDRVGYAESERTGIGIAMCDYERFVDGDTGKEKVRRTKIIDTIKGLSGMIADEIVLIDFNGHKEFGDASIHGDIKRCLPDGVKLRHLSYNDNPLAVLQEIGKLKLVIAMRLHAAVFGFVTGTPAILLSYHPKCVGWGKQIGLDEKYVLDSSEFDVGRLRRLVMEILDGGFKEPRLARREAEKLAMLNFTTPVLKRQ